MNSIVKYYNEEYNEEERLNNNCDNRHKVEREVKLKILNKLIKEYNIKDIGDICCGTGLYSIYLANKGCNVKACDIVEKHISILNNKCNKYSLNIESHVCNARNTPFEDNSFDMTMVAGAIYHTHKQEDKIRILEEAKRITKNNGLMVVDYLSSIHGYIQHVLLDNDVLLDESRIKNIDKVFSYDNYENIINYALKTNIKLEKVFGTDGITRFIKDDINKLDDKHLNKWIDFVYNNSQNENIIDLSEHCLVVYVNKK